MRLVDRVILSALEALVSRGQLVLRQGATVERLHEEVLGRFRTAPASAQLAPFLAKVLVDSPLVEELFADNEEIVELFNAPTER